MPVWREGGAAVNYTNLYGYWPWSDDMSNPEFQLDLTTAFSLVIGHVGATIVLVPLAINLALAAGGNPTAFALIVALSASNNFMTASNPVISMITGPAGYSSRELWRIGGPLSLVYTLLAVAMVNVLF